MQHIFVSGQFSYIFFFFFLDFIYLFLERGRETSMCERSIDWLPLVCTPIRDQAPTQTCALTRNRTSNLWLCGWHSTEHVGQRCCNVSWLASFPLRGSPTMGTQVTLLLVWLCLFPNAISFALIALAFVIFICIHCLFTLIFSYAYSALGSF